MVYPSILDISGVSVLTHSVVKLKSFTYLRVEITAFNVLFRMVTRSLLLQVSYYEVHCKYFCGVGVFMNQDISK